VHGKTLSVDRPRVKPAGALSALAARSFGAKRRALSVAITRRSSGPGCASLIADSPSRTDAGKRRDLPCSSMHGVPARCRWAVASPVIGAGLVVLCTVLSLTPVARTGLVTIAAIGPFLWLMRAGREVVRLFDGRSTPRRVLVYVGLLVALTIVELATIYNWMRHSFGGMTSRVAPLYFSISTFTTTGYGDIHPSGINDASRRW
jgi:hypothetical protein